MNLLLSFNEVAAGFPACRRAVANRASGSSYIQFWFSSPAEYRTRVFDAVKNFKNFYTVRLPIRRAGSHGSTAARMAAATSAAFRLVIFALLFLGTFLSTPAYANPADFTAANALYEQQKFPEAVVAYEKLINSGSTAPNIFFNLGNAHFKVGEYGKAIAAYRQAQKLAPRDPDIRANLRFARNKTQNVGASAPEESWLHRLTSNEWLLLASVPFWLCFILLAFAQIKPDWRRIVRSYAAVLGCLALLFGICAGIAAQKDMEKAAVVTSNEAVVRHGPFAESQTAFNLRDGAELVVLDQRENWIQISAGPNRVGWVRTGQVTVIN